MSKHTPGPWVVHPSHQTGRAAAAYYIDSTSGDARCRAVAHVKNSPRLPVYANARLIAAAPELLECLSIATVLLCNVKPFASHSDILADCIEVCSAAIANATGA